MNQQKEERNPLETEPITRLIAKYSIPTALTLMVNYLYNIVDQIFVDVYKRQALRYELRKFQPALDCVLP